MDYTTINKEKVFKDRTDIDEYDVNNPTMLDAIMLKRIENSKIIEFEKASEYILKCFNNAYYITILILKEKHPVHYFKKYINIAESDVPKRDKYGYAKYEYLYLECMTMAMVVNYLRACAPELYSDENRNPLLKAIINHHRDDRIFSPPAHYAPLLFFDNVLPNSSISSDMVNRELFYPQFPSEESNSDRESTQSKKRPNDNEKLISRIKELEEENQILKNDIEAYQTQEKKGINASQAAIFLTTVVHYLGGLPQNGRQSLAPLLSSLWGYTDTTASRALGNDIKDEFVANLAKQFETIAPKIRTLIKELPQELDEKNKKRLKNLRKQTVKN